MKRILFVLPSFNIGGTTISLYNLLSIIDNSKYNIDIFALDSSGPYKEKMQNCNILGDNLFFSSKLSNKNLLKIILFFCLKATRKIIQVIFKKTDLFYRFGSQVFKVSKYDIVISFQEGRLTELVSYIPAKKLIAWIHSDYSRYLSLANHPKELPFYKRYQNVVCVSDYSKRIAQDCLPEIRDRILSIHNIINYKAIREAAKEKNRIDERFDTSTFSIVSIGRIDPVKQFEKIPNVAAQIKKKGFSFKWYLIGDTKDEFVKKEIIDNIRVEKLENDLILLGEKINVYPYIKNSNLLVSTSLSESFPLVINEAKVLGTPVIASNFESAHESVENRKTGYIVPLDKMADKIIEMMTNNTEYLSIKNYLQIYRYDNSSIMDQIYAVFES